MLRFLTRNKWTVQSCIALVSASAILICYGWMESEKQDVGGWSILRLGAAPSCLLVDGEQVIVGTEPLYISNRIKWIWPWNDYYVFAPATLYRVDLQQMDIVQREAFPDNYIWGIGTFNGYLAIASSSHLLLDGNTFRPLVPLSGIRYSLAKAPSGNKVAFSGTLRVLMLDKVLHVSTTSCTLASLQFLSDDTLLGLELQSNELQEFSLVTGSVKRIASAKRYALSHDRSIVAVATTGTIDLLSTANYTNLCSIQLPEEPVRIEFDYSDNMLFACANALWVYHLPSRKLRTVDVPRFLGVARRMAASPAGLLVIGTDRGYLAHRSIQSITPN